MAAPDLCKIAARNDLSAFRALRLARPRDVHRLVNTVRPSDGVTPLMRACQKGHRDMTRELLSAGAGESVNFATYHRLSTALIISAAYGSDQCVSTLSLYCASTLDPRQCDRDQWTALMWAAFNGRPKCVLALLRFDKVTLPVLALFHGMRKGRLVCCLILCLSVSWRLFRLALSLNGQLVWRIRSCILALSMIFVNLVCELSVFCATVALAAGMLVLGQWTAYTRQRRDSLGLSHSTPRSSPIAGAGAGAGSGAGSGFGRGSHGVMAESTGNALGGPGPVATTRSRVSQGRDRNT